MPLAHPVTRALKTLVTAVLPIGCIVTLLVCSTPVRADAAEFPIEESFTKSAPATWVIAGDATLTAGDQDPENAGWLRLTDNTSFQTGYAYYNDDFATDSGLVISFDYVAWGGTSTGADGFSFFLFDGSTPEEDFNIGGTGGSLGYAPHTGSPGLSNGYVGVGFDEFGNYSNPREGRIGGPGFKRTAVVIRGPYDVGEGYEYLTGTQTDEPLDVSDAERPASDGPGYRKVEIDIEPVEESYQISVRMAFGAGSPLQEVVAPYTLPHAPPDTLKMGFAASTGSLTNYHEIRHLTVTSADAPTLLEGIVSDTGEANPIPDASVEVTQTTSITSTSTDDQGAYALTLEPGPLAMTVSADGYCPAQVESFAVGGVTTTEDVALSPTTFEGMVRAEGMEAPIVGASVALTDSQGTPFTTASGSRGTYGFTSIVTDRLSSGPVTVTVSADGYESTTVNTTLDPCGTTLDIDLCTADIALEQSDHLGDVSPGQRLTYTLSVENQGSVTATNVVLTDVLPAYVTFEDASPQCASSTYPTCTWELGDLAVGQSTTVELVGRVAVSLPYGTTDLINHAWVSTSCPEADVTNNDSEDRNTVTAYPDLTLHKTRATDTLSVTADSRVTYTLWINNHGHAVATEPVITDVLDTNTTYVTNTAELVLGGQGASTTAYTETAHTLVFQLPHIPPDTAAYLTYTVKTDADLGGASAITNTATLGLLEKDGDPGNNTETLILPAQSGVDMRLTKRARSRLWPLQPGGQVVYTVEYVNLGDQQATDVVLTDTLSSHMEFLDGGFDAVDGEYLSETHTISVTWATIDAGARGVFSYTGQVVSVLPAGTDGITNTAVIASAEEDLIPGDNQASTYLPVEAQPDLVVKKTDAHTEVWPGQELTYTLSYSNVGTIGASGVVITDTLIQHLGDAEASDGGSYDEERQVITWTLGTLPVGEPHTLLVTATVSADALAGEIAINRVDITDDGLNGADAVPDDNFNGDFNVVGRPHIRLLKSSSCPVFLGDRVTYTIAYENDGLFAGHNVIISDALPAHTTLITPSVDPGTTIAGDAVRWDLGTVASGVTGTLSFAARVDAGAGQPPAPITTTQFSNVQAMEGHVVVTSTTDSVARPWCVGEGCDALVGHWGGETPSVPSCWRANPRYDPEDRFDESLWTGPVTATVEPEWLDPESLGAEWVAMTNTAQAGENHSYFRQPFCLPMNAALVDARIEIAAADQAILYLNQATPLAIQESAGADGVYPVSGEVQAGINMLGIRLAHSLPESVQHRDYSGLLYRVEANYDGLRPFVSVPPVVLGTGQPVTLTIDEAVLGGRRPFSYTYDFGIGHNAYTTATSRAHTFSVTGTHLVTVTARDQFGCTGVDHTMVTVLPDGTRLLANSARATYKDSRDVNYATVSGTGEPIEPSCDVSLSLTASPDPAIKGQPIAHTLIVRNDGVERVENAGVVGTLLGDISGTSTWTCTASSTGRCSASGSGHIDDDVQIPPGGTLTYYVLSSVALNAGGDLVYEAAMRPPEGSGIRGSCAAFVARSLTENPPDAAFPVGGATIAGPKLVHPGIERTWMEAPGLILAVLGMVWGILVRLRAR